MLEYAKVKCNDCSRKKSNRRFRRFKEENLKEFIMNNKER